MNLKVYIAFSKKKKKKGFTLYYIIISNFIMFHKIWYREYVIFIVEQILLMLYLSIYL